MGVKNVDLLPIKLPLVQGQMPVPLPNLVSISQEENYWCWAACGLMVWRQFNTGLSVCETVNILRKADCCNHRASKKCSDAADPNDIVTLYDKLNFNCGIGVDPRTQTQPVVANNILKQLIDLKRPVEIGYQIDNPASYHVVIVAGAVPSGTTPPKFLVFDTLNDDGCLSIDELETLDNKGKWLMYWTDIFPKT